MQRQNPALFEPLISAADVAEFLQIEERTVLRWAREGKLPARKFGKFWRFRASQLDLFVRGQEKVVLATSQSARVN
jgi:excisionase family DNA binding protein